MTKKTVIFLIALLVLLFGNTVAQAEQSETGYPWGNHTEPYDFLFGNLIDNHQQTQLLPSDSLVGYIYIRFTGEETDGIPIAVRADCTDPSLDCRVGWVVRGVPIQATLVQKAPRKWKVDASTLPKSPGYNHFHWVGSPMKPCGLILDDGETSVLYNGYLLKRTAVQQFYWLGGSGNDDHNGRLVNPGIDPHSNIVTSWDYSGSDGGHGGGCDGHDGDSDSGCDGHDDGSSHPDCGGH